MWSLGMILHKLLFFKSPYQYASDGEDLGSKVGETDKMDRLEQEVLGYPGFVFYFFQLNFQRYCALLLAFRFFVFFFPAGRFG